VAFIGKQIFTKDSTCIVIKKETTVDKTSSLVPKQIFINALIYLPSKSASNNGDPPVYKKIAPAVLLP